MNCREGDRAVIIGPDGARCVGMGVQCVTLVPKGTRFAAEGWETTEDCWFVDRDVWTKQYPCMPVRFACLVGDRFLMPIRPERDPEEIPAERGVTA